MQKLADGDFRRIAGMRRDGASFSQIAAQLGAGATKDSVRNAYSRAKSRLEKAAPGDVASEDNSRILVISDMHAPYAHPSTVAFLTGVAEKYRPTRVICIGDEVDHHAMSFHDSDPDLPAAGDELRKAIDQIQPLYSLFPRVDIVHSNHGSMAYRRGRHHGVPRKYLRDYREVLEAPEGWVWHPELIIDLPNGNQCFFHHGLSADILKVVQQRAVCVVQGHYHTSFGFGTRATRRLSSGACRRGA